MPVTVTALTRPDVTIETLNGLARSIDDNARDERLLAGRIRRLSAGRAKGRTLDDLLATEPHPTTLELAAKVLKRLAGASGALRRTLASGLRAQGASISAIAERFGVSRQRVSAMLHRDDD